jgi:peptidoglycan/xylan/chitin deacetylase (PgdA/CDA1 family)
MKNILSIDLEPWFYIYEASVKENLSDFSNRKVLDNNYVPDSTGKLLDLLDKYGQCATFFIPGELYEWYPDVIEEIKKKGHEIGYHTHSHLSLTNDDILEKELKRSSKFIEKFKPLGFRAPNMIMTSNSMLSLKSRGFKYSSSTYDKFEIKKIYGIDEIPVSAINYFGSTNNQDILPKNLTLKMLLKKIPFGSGLFISLFGSRTTYFINYLNKRNKPAILIVHPWQLYGHDKIRGLSYVMKTLLKNPLCVPYAIEVLEGFKKLLQNHKFVSFQKYFIKDK